MLRGKRNKKSPFNIRRFFYSVLQNIVPRRIWSCEFVQNTSLIFYAVTSVVDFGFELKNAHNSSLENEGTDMGVVQFWSESTISVFALSEVRG